MLITPQETTLGSLSVYDKTRLREALLGNGDISYGINGKHTFRIITGRTHLEEELPVFSYPYLLDNNIIIDERPYTKDKTKYELSEVLNLRLPFDIPLVSGILLDKGDLGEFRQFYIKTMQILIGGKLKNTLNLSVADSLILNNIIAVYATNIISDYNNIDACVGVAQANVIGETLHENDIKEYIGGQPLNNIHDLCVILSGIEDGSRNLRAINPEVVNDAVGSLVFQTHRLALLIGIESPYSLLSIIFSYLDNPLYKKTGIVFSLGIFKSALGIDQFNTKMKTLLKHYKVDNLF